MLPTTLGLCGVCIILQHWRRLSQDPPRWNVQPSNFQQSLAIPHCRETWGRVLSDAHNQRFGDLRVPLFDHVDAISPTGPKSCHARPHPRPSGSTLPTRMAIATPPERSQRLLPLPRLLSCTSTRWCHDGPRTTRTDQGCTARATRSCAPGCSAHEQQKPTCLGILHQVSAMKQKILLR